MINNTQLFDGVVIFVEVVNNKSFSAAAEKLNHSPSHISKEVSKLESRLGVRLLQRTTRKIKLTPEGDVYFRQCMQLIEDTLAVEHLINHKQSEPQGTLKFSCPISFGLSRVKPILAQFMAKYPQIKLEIDLTDHRVDIIEQGFDVVIRAVDQMPDSSLIARQFMTSKAVTVAAPSYIKKYGAPTKPKDLVQHQTISYRNLKQPNIWQYKDENEKIIDIQVDSKVITNSPEMALSLCLAGQGIIRTPMFNLANEIANGELIPLLASYEHHNIGVYLVYPSRQHLSAKVQCFNEFIIEHIGNNTK